MREFGQLESAVMDVLWAEDQPCLVREVRERLRYPRPVAYTTVMTVMTILHGKGVLRRDKQGRAWRYWPAERREEHDARLMAEALRSGGDPPVTLRRFAEQATEDELEALRRAIRAVRSVRGVRSAGQHARPSVRTRPPIQQPVPRARRSVQRAQPHAQQPVRPPVRPADPADRRAG